MGNFIPHLQEPILCLIWTKYVPAVWGAVKAVTSVTFLFVILLT